MNFYKQNQRLVWEAKKHLRDDFGNRMNKNYSENQKLFYSMLKRLKQRKTPRLLSIKDKDRNILTEKAEIMERWLQYFEKLTENIQRETTWDEVIRRELKRTPFNRYQTKN